MRLFWQSVMIVLALAGCHASVNDDAGSNRKEVQSPVARGQGPDAAPSAADPLGARDPAPGAPPDPGQADDRPRPVMQLQVVLDRLGFTPGVIDGEMGLSTRNAVAGFQESRGMPATGQMDGQTRAALAAWQAIPATRVVVVPVDFAAGPFSAIPSDPGQQAKLPSLGYQTLDEKLAERFHTTPETLLALNPALVVATTPGTIATARAHFRAGQPVRVPNVGMDRVDDAKVDDGKWRATLVGLGVGSEQPRATRIVVSKSQGTLKAYDAAGRLVGMYTATMGSRHDPLPLGNWKIVGIAHNPDFSFNPRLLWDIPDTAAKQRLPPGPNGPVGVAWIRLSKPHYGIHGTSEPATIGRAQSHGCVRLTNWDIARLAQMVGAGTQVVFGA